MKTLLNTIDELQEISTHSTTAVLIHPTKP